MTRTGLLMKVGIFVVASSVLFSMAGVQEDHRTDTFNEDTASGTQVEATNQDPESSFFESGLRCALGGLLFSAESCGESVSALLETFGLEGVSQTVITVTNGIQAFTDGLKSFLTFNVPGAPGWVRATVAVPLNVGLIYVIVAIGRGI